jgi:hypothetical protein
MVMIKNAVRVAIIALLAIATAGVAQIRTFRSVTQEQLLNPSPDDWLMYSRTYDAQRFSPTTPAWIGGKFSESFRVIVGTLPCRPK